MKENEFFEPLTLFLSRLPALLGTIGKGHFENGNWWVKFALDITHPLSWQVVQELAHVLNYVSLEEKLPTIFMPVSPPPYLNGGPQDFLCWVIESKDAGFTPKLCAQWLKGRLPRPIEDEKQWLNDGE